LRSGAALEDCYLFAYRIVLELNPLPALEIVFSHSTILASAITGCIWALWHWPMIIADALDVVPKGSGYSVAETRDFHLLYVLAVFTLLLIGSRIIMCWIQGNSSYVIWSSVVYHATHNLYVCVSKRKGSSSG
jgi:membrane protease YdiL (CAAX protease family)